MTLKIAKLLSREIIWVFSSQGAALKLTAFKACAEGLRRASLCDVIFTIFLTHLMQPQENDQVKAEVRIPELMHRDNN